MTSAKLVNSYFGDSMRNSMSLSEMGYYIIRLSGTRIGF